MCNMSSRQLLAWRARCGIRECASWQFILGNSQSTAMHTRRNKEDPGSPLTNPSVHVCVATGTLGRNVANTCLSFLPIFGWHFKQIPPIFELLPQEYQIPNNECMVLHLKKTHNTFILRLPCGSGCAIIMNTYWLAGHECLCPCGTLQPLSISCSSGSF